MPTVPNEQGSDNIKVEKAPNASPIVEMSSFGTDFSMIEVVDIESNKEIDIE